MLETMVALAASAASNVVAAMATDAWRTARDGLSRLFGRQSEQRQAAITAQLDGNEALVEGAADPDQARQQLAGLWQMELQALLQSDPELADELRTLVEQIKAKLPPPQQVWTQHVTASGQGSFAGGSIGGNVNFNFSGPPPSPGEQPGQPS
jgi:hypothetical protein